MGCADPDLRLIDGPAEAPATLLLAHGAGAPPTSPFLATIAAGLAARNWRVVRFPFPYMTRQLLSGRRSAPDRLPRLLEAFREQVSLEGPGRPLILAGKSMGGRVASLLIDELATAGAVQGCVCLGFPFHPPGRPLQLRGEHLATLRHPTLILQGERDSFGRREEVETYPLSRQVTVRWIPSGDHSLRPTRSSGLAEEQTLEMAVAHIHRFCSGLPCGAPRAQGA